MPERKRSFINVDELMPQVSLEQAASFYGVALPELHRTGKETRARCFLACNRTEETGDRALAIQENDPAKKWRCHQYGCGKGGNLIGLCDLMKPGANGNGRPRGGRFKEIAADLQAMASGETSVQARAPTEENSPQKSESTPKVNPPLAESANERARELVTLHEQLITDAAEMPPAASRYFRSRPFLTPEVCRRWRMGYLPQDAKTMLRGKIVYAYDSPTGEILTYFGRDPKYEERHQRWIAGGKEDREPIKTQFVKGFQRGIELYGEQAVLQSNEVDPEKKRNLVIVEGPNDAIRLHTLGVPAVALCSNTITREQAVKAAQLASAMPGGSGVIVLLLDCDEEGVNGMEQVLPLLAVHAPGVTAAVRRGGVPLCDVSRLCSRVECGTLRGCYGQHLKVEAAKGHRTPHVSQDPQAPETPIEAATVEPLASRRVAERGLGAISSPERRALLERSCASQSRRPVGLRPPTHPRAEPPVVAA
ncbi:DNA primase [Durusdinium trenchii]|uniref:DNA primase n=1 Tax=Durusdinium trenchii TaxID=1381693 RepID=A0ABP0Q3G7_9DINO